MTAREFIAVCLSRDFTSSAIDRDDTGNSPEFWVEKGFVSPVYEVAP
jgi:hypothetical protein